jgi:tetratricopeptide (TPR) repeat protein
MEVSPMGGEHAVIRAAKLCLGVSVLALLGPVTVLAQVKAREEKITLPTYEVGPPEPNPIFYSGRAYQGAKGPVYPYPLLDKLTDVKRDRIYRLLVLENEYVRIGVLPEIGGRIFEAVDKTNGYDFVYRQHVIKPALIGMLGAWISGGVEWNIPHHHRATSFMPVDSAIENNSDGSATIWIGEIELRHRMKWIVGLTLRPGSSVLEVTTKVLNRTPFAHSMLAFANVAVHANESYQVLFPPSTEVATFHGKNQFSRWPVSTEVFNGQDYTKGIDVSWWKSHARPTSFFAFDDEEDFLGGYDHGRKAGVVFVGDHNVVPGKKLWTWGTGSEGKTWEKILTDADGPYLELMIGAWSDNQPDYSWIKPGEERSVSQFWYPIRGLGGLKNANREAACDLELTGNRARIAFHATSERKGARFVLKSGDKVLFEDVFDIGPGSPYEKTCEIAAGIRAESLELVLTDASGGAELVRYAPQPQKNLPLPKPVTPPGAPKDIPTIEELYLAGQRLEQFHNPALEPYPYYEEALRRDPSDVRANTALAVLYLKRGMYAEAEARLRTAVARLTANYTRPKDGEAFYYLGVASRRLGKTIEAEDAFQRAAWDPAWQAVSFNELAEMASAGGDFAGALGFVDRAIKAGPSSTRSLVLKAALLRRLGRLDEADDMANHALARDPLDAWARREKYIVQLAKTGPQSKETREPWDRFASLAPDGSPNVLEVALDYADCGLWQETAGVAWLWVPGPLDIQEMGDPLAAYLTAYAFERAESGEKARTFLNLAARMPAVRVFPHALEFVDILEWAATMNPADGHAPYYLGNLLFDLQPEKALAAWERARGIDPGLAVLHRNLGLAYARVKNDLPAALASLEKAVALDPKDARLYFELDQLAESADIDPMIRLARLEKNQEVIAANDNALAREVGLLVRVGRAARALEILKEHHFHIWEGGGEIHGLWVEANLAEGRRRLEKSDHRRALEAFNEALSYPRNLDVGPPSSGPGSPKIYVHLGQAQRALGHTTLAESCFEKALAFGTGLSEQAYYRGLALKALGRQAEAESLFEGLVERARDALAAAPAMDFFEKFGERQSSRVRQANFHFLVGLGLLGSGQAAEAKAEFEMAVSMDSGHPEARRFMK